ncbi:MAG TPA: hypothetical protein PLA43_02365 [Bryobacteraceae bacterium]|nr:hypothetical protein [Bryobacteraceae bacterium]HOQ44454.1 hypothetical protein [Bryobacteraceae bacterium]HPQ16187.1 hypothetical protein [Bryobacteraceae bacterium]HPU70773.1 hypothetical protein [Bryobacteraceae bacterium]
MTCKICEKRRPRRSCPGVSGEICSLCCGTERENSIACPLDCPYLQEARIHEKPPEIDPETIPNLDIRITDEFLRSQEPLLAVAMREFAAGVNVPGVVDFDVREALDSLVRTYRTRQSGLYYEDRPANLLAAGIHDRVQQGLEQFRQAVAERSGIHSIRDADILGVLVFLQRLEYRLNNGRKRGRAFLDFLSRQPAFGEERRSPLALP